MTEPEDENSSIQRKNANNSRGDYMQIQMRYFASLREITGLHEEALSIPEESTVAGMRALLLERYPGVERGLARAVCDVNHQYVNSETILKEHDEVEVIHAVGGGLDRLL